MYYALSYPVEATGTSGRQPKLPLQRPEPPDDHVQSPTDQLRLGVRDLVAPVRPLQQKPN